MNLEYERSSTFCFNSKMNIVNVHRLCQFLYKIVNLQCTWITNEKILEINIRNVHYEKTWITNYYVG